MLILINISIKYNHNDYYFYDNIIKIIKLK